MIHYHFLVYIYPVQHKFFYNTMIVSDLLLEQLEKRQLEYPI
jgi:hypothetical protein